MKIRAEKKHGLWTLEITINGQTRTAWATTFRGAILAGGKLEVVR